MVYLLPSDGMRTSVSIVMLAASAASASLLVMMSRGPLSISSSPLVGLYEFKATKAQQAGFSLDAMFLDWNDPDAVPKLQSFLSSATSHQRLPLITLEPFPDRAAGRTNVDLLPDVLSGRHDQRLVAIAKVMADNPGAVLLRFAHEMDKAGQYPWAFTDPSHYLRLYHYVHNKVSTLKPKNIRWVWSPIGSSSADRFWPGDHYADLIGISIYTSRAWSGDGALQSFSNRLQRKRWLHERYGLPLLIAETGVSGSSIDQQPWLAEALQSLRRFPEVCGLVYFHAPQPEWMPLPTGHEDWQLNPEVLHWFQQQLPLPSRPGLSCVET